MNLVSSTTPAAILAAVIAAFVFGLGGTTQQAPTASIVAANNPDTAGPDLKIQHKGGDLLKGGEWKLSIVKVGSPPLFNNSIAGSTLGVGNQIITSNTTDIAAGIIVVDNQSVQADPTGTCCNIVSGQKYDVKLVHIPSNAMLLDTVVEVR